MAKEDLATGFTDVDRMTNPEVAVQAMDAATAKETNQVRRQQTFALLEAKEGGCFLDVGCGPGDAVRALAQIVGVSGRVVGVDSSETMIAEARKRAQGTNLPVEYYVGDARHLDFADNTFDGCRSERTLQHVDDPRQVLREMFRVARAGARLVVLEPDWGTFVIDAPDRTLTRTLLNFFCDSIRNGWIGRHLPGLFREAQLTEVAVVADTVSGTNLTAVDQILGLRKTVGRAQEAGVVSVAEAARWMNSVETAHQAGHFFYAVTMFCVSGRKP